MAVAGGALVLVVAVLTAQLCGCTADAGDGFSVEFIHRDSPRSPFHDPTLTPHGRTLAAVRRSTARASALARSYAGESPHGAVSEVISRPWDYLMYVNVGTPPTRMLALAESASDLVWFRCANGTASPPAAATADVVFDPSSSSSFGGRVSCQSEACFALTGASCDASNSCQYTYSYGDGSLSTGFLSTETFSFDSVPGGCVGCREHPRLLVPRVNFGCTTSTNESFPGSSFPGDGIVGLGGGPLSLVTQLGAGTTLGRRFSYCLTPLSTNASSALNFGARAAVTEPGAVQTPLVHNDVASFYTIELLSVKIENATLAQPPYPSRVVLDIGTSLTSLDKAILDPLVEELTRRIQLPRVTISDKLLQLCYSAAGPWSDKIPDVTLELLGVSGNVTVTLKPENLFVEEQENVICLAMTPVTKEAPLSIIGNIVQQNMHVGFDLEKNIVTFAPADCATSYASPSAHV